MQFSEKRQKLESGQKCCQHSNEIVILFKCCQHKGKWEKVDDASITWRYYVLTCSCPLQDESAHHGSIFLQAPPSQTAGNQVPGLEASEGEGDSTTQSEDDDDGSTTSGSDEDDESVGYTMATKADYVPVEVKTKAKTRKGEAEKEAGGEEATSSSNSSCDHWTQVRIEWNLDLAEKSFVRQNDIFRYYVFLADYMEMYCKSKMVHAKSSY